MAEELKNRRPPESVQKDSRDGEDMAILPPPRCHVAPVLPRDDGPSEFGRLLQAHPRNPGESDGAYNVRIRNVLDNRMIVEDLYPVSPSLPRTLAVQNKSALAFLGLLTFSILAMASGSVSLLTVMGMFKVVVSCVAAYAAGRVLSHGLVREGERQQQDETRQVETYGFPKSSFEIPMPSVKLPLVRNKTTANVPQEHNKPELKP
ncbi:MAG TPA: hypothetical protein DCW68_06450 [Rhodospirillaceae bacterium]|nr:MAG: hypothetical protein A2018_03775 [Alphaproteobacteria bacterium GWF2_58_20]HAU29729.1 hypothetical protein [Rhodospirillaceae bacterium]